MAKKQYELTGRVIYLDDEGKEDWDRESTFTVSMDDPADGGSKVEITSFRPDLKSENLAYYFDMFKLLLQNSLNEITEFEAETFKRLR